MAGAPAPLKRPSLARRALRRARFTLSLRALPPRVARFYWRADRAARRSADRFSLDSAARPGDLRELLRVARGREAVAELGTGTAWTAIALALAERGRRVISYDPIVRPEREAYLRLAGRSARERIELVARAGSAGAQDAPAVDMLFIDSSHERAETVAEFEAWRPRLREGAIVAFHDYSHPEYPGVAEAIAQLGLRGEARGGLFVWREAGSGANIRSVRCGR
jgi:predicted O-methyltransferase YrrM